MNVLELELAMTTPAFLGGADQSAEWRSPPFKALLRHWWRIAVAKDLGCSYEAIRASEGVLFGHAWLKHQGKAWAVKGRVQIRLSDWTPAARERWGRDTRIPHPEVDRGGQVGAHLYLGYGPLTYAKGETALKTPPAIEPGATASWRIRFPDRVNVDEFTQLDVKPGLERALRLIHLFGTIGGRSRNGWGSLVITKPDDLGAECLSETIPEASLRPFEECLQLEYPHAIGTDEAGPLVWRTAEAFDGASSALDALAKIKIAFRTALDVTRSEVAERHLLAYPVTHHDVRSWGRQSRLANQLRFKVHRAQDEGRDRFIGIAFHAPHGLPRKLEERLAPADRGWVRSQQFPVWRKVHSVLDAAMLRWS